MKLFLIVANGKHKGMPIEIKGDLFMLGSDQVCQLRSRLPGIAPKHCALVMRDKKVFLQDLGGETTLLNDEAIPAGLEWPLHAGDRLVVGPLEFVIQFQELQLSQRDAEEWALRALDKPAGKDKGDAATQPVDDRGQPAAPKPPENAASAAASILDKMSAHRGQLKGRLRVSLEEGITVLHFNDTNLVEEAELHFIKKEIMDNLNRPNMRVLLDFKNVTRMSSTGGEMILDLRRRLRTKGGSLALCRLQRELHMVLDTLNILQSVPHFDDRDDALAARW